jgi:hypothetical protein
LESAVEVEAAAATSAALLAASGNVVWSTAKSAMVVDGISA